MPRPREREGEIAGRTYNVPIKAHDLCLARGMNVSRIVSKALTDAAYGDVENEQDSFEQERADLLSRVSALESKKDKIDKLVAEKKKEKEKFLNEFVSSTSSNIISDERMMGYWIKRTDIPAHELIAAKQDYIQRLRLENRQKRQLTPEQREVAERAAKELEQSD